MAVDQDGMPVKVGDIVEVVVKYRVMKVYDDGHLLVHKCYDIPSTAVKVIGEKV